MSLVYRSRQGQALNEDKEDRQEHIGTAAGTASYGPDIGSGHEAGSAPDSHLLDAAKQRLIKVHSAHTAAARTTSTHAGAAIARCLRRRFGPGSMGGKRRILCSQVLLTTTGAFQYIGIRTSTEELFEPGSAIITAVFKDRHGLH
jgi:hypothetical protein